MDEGHGTREIQVRQVQVEVPDLGGRQHPFVYDGMARQAGNVEVRAHFLAGRRNLLFRQAPDYVELALEVHLVLQVGAAADEDLDDARAHGGRLFADAAVVDGHFAPAQDGLSFFADDALEGLDLLLPETVIAVGKNHAHAVLPFRRQVEAQDGALAAQKSMGNLDHDAGAVAALMVRAFAAAVFQVFQYVQGVVDDVVRPFPLDVDDKADAAGIVFERRIVQALWCRQIPECAFHVAASSVK